MITILTHFRAQVVKFVFAGRNSGQKERKTTSAGTQIPAGPEQTPRVALMGCTRSSIATPRIMGQHVPGDRKDAGLPIKLYPVGGISGELDFAGFCPQPGDHVANGTASTKLCQQQSSVGRVVPYPELVRGTP